MISDFNWVAPLGQLGSLDIANTCGDPVHLPLGYDYAGNGGYSEGVGFGCFPWIGGRV